MKQYLSEVVTALYRAPRAGLRRVFALSREEAGRLPSLPTFAIISITAPERPPANLNSPAHVLRLSFADVDFHSADLSLRAQAKLPYAFTTEQANEVRDFVESLTDDVNAVVVHCEGGFSRSCAIALALHRLYGYEADIERLTQANPSVLRLMMEQSQSSKKRKNRRSK
ncbi:dual specificity protein phosphatase family protein [Cupriavidus pauculus]|uniref:Tyrosine specific protein phosphatases domain-containing protein n=1 Tax=Cupriavidus pauculus TaxID=82633 RepID=A0A3G8H021_9BURK|nr:dual specificity protein phosphatase family protein [Cupriavidus pauculus]AZG13784.1 hypothetical protein EHF44_10160 [Cupriavidus pauculus]